MISKGATTIWERWDTDTQDGGMNGESQKILSGNFEAWCYQTLGGINYDPQHPGFKHIVLSPRPVGDLVGRGRRTTACTGESRVIGRSMRDDFNGAWWFRPTQLQPSLFPPGRGKASENQGDRSAKQMA